MIYHFNIADHFTFSDDVISLSIEFALVTPILLYLLYRWRILVLNKRETELEAIIQSRNQEVINRNEEILKQQQEYQKQQDKMVLMYEELMQSIHTAQHIQELHLPPEEQIKKHLPEFFALYLPKDIVSGDFYWMYEKYEKIYLAAVDCTGHGVAGAFMSIIGNSLLTQIVTQNPTYNAGEILDQLSANLVRTLHQDKDKSTFKEGMDIAFCIIDVYENQMHFAGANNPLYFIKDGVLEQIKGDNRGIGLQKGDQIKRFKNHLFEMDEDISYYIFSDGFASQFGGHDGNEKLKHMRFRESLLNIQEQPMIRQRDLLMDMLKKWQNNTEQTDDILVLGFKKPNVNIDNW